MQRNLFVSTGFFATLSSSIIVEHQALQKRIGKKNYLLIVISKEFSTTDSFELEAKKQIDFAKNVSRWYKINVVKEDNFSLSVYNNEAYDPKLINSLFDGDLSSKAFFELYISALNIRSKLSVAFKKVSIIDEGVGSHVQLKNSSDLSGFSTFYKIIPLKNELEINSINLPKPLLYKKLNKLNKIYKTPKIKSSTSIVAISSFYFITKEKAQLIDAYKGYIKTLLSKGGDVKVKLHPRNNKDDFAELENNLLNVDIPLLDMYLIQNKKFIKNLYSMNSSILFMSKYVYGIPSIFIEQNIADEYTKNINVFYTKHINS